VSQAYLQQKAMFNLPTNVYNQTVAIQGMIVYNNTRVFNCA